MPREPSTLTTVAHADSDGDGVTDCRDGCPADPFKTEPGLCGCGVPEDDCLPSVCQGSFGFSLIITGRIGRDLFDRVRAAVSIRRSPRLYLLPLTCFAFMVPVCSPYSVHHFCACAMSLMGQDVNGQHL